MMWIVMWFGSCWKSDVNYMFIRKIIRKGFKFYFVGGNENGKYPWKSVYPNSTGEK